MKKVLIKSAAQVFRQELQEIQDFVKSASFSQSTDAYKSWVYSYAIIRTYALFESFILKALTGAVNSDTQTTAANLGIRLPKHLTADVCEYLVTGGKYLNFKGRDGLIELLKKYLPNDHYLVRTCKKTNYRDALDQMVALRNFAAHHSDQSKRSAMRVLGLQRLSSAGAWLKCDGRLASILNSLSDLAAEIERLAPY